MEIFDIANKLGMITSEVYNYAQSLITRGNFFCIGIIISIFIMIGISIVEHINEHLETKEKILLFGSIIVFITCLVFFLKTDNLFSELELEYKVLLIQKYGAGQII